MTTPTPPTHEDLLRRIRELEKEVAHWRNQVSHQQYGLVWMDVPEAFDTESLHSIPILEEVSDLSFRQDDGKPTHILIEGDNYHSLTCLNYTHRNSIDVIYIDPPYNTGNDGFTYKDSRFITEHPNGDAIKKTHPLRHSSWLSFMAKRLRLAHSLLNDRGVIFISIDDNEVAQLRLLCNEIFEERNFIAEMVWQQGKKHIGSFIGINHEYMLVFAKNKDLINDNTHKWQQRKEGLEKIYSTYDKLKKKHGENYEAIEKGLRAFYDSLPESDAAFNSKHYNRVDARGIFFADNISQGTGNGPCYDVLHPTTRLAVMKPAGGWRYAYDTMQRLLAEDRIYFGEDENKVPCRKRYLHETEYELPSSVFYRDGRGASKEVETILERKKPFNNPKDRNEIERILNFRPNSIVLDFFAGSGTTMHAVSSLNAKDGGSRQCILCQASEADICRSVTLERNRRVMQGYTNAKGEEVPGLGGSLKFYRTAFVGQNTAREASDADRIDLATRAGCLLALAENTLYETRRAERFQFFTDHHGRHTAIYFSEDYSDFPTFEAQVRNLSGSTAIYVFSWGDGAEFAPMFDDLPRATVKSIPQPILDIYKSLNP